MSLGSIYSTLNCEWMVIPNTLWLYIVRIHLVMGIFLIDSHLFVLFFYVLHVSQYHYLSINLCAVQLNPAIWIRKLSLMLLMNFVFENSGGLFQWLNFSSIVPFFQYSKKISIYSSNFPFQMTGVCLSNWRKWIIFDLWKLCWKNNPQKLHATSIKNPTAFYHPFNQPKERNEKNHETPSSNLVSIAFATCVENNMYDN